MRCHHKDGKRMESAFSAVLGRALAHACTATSAIFGWLGIAFLAWGGARALYLALSGGRRRDAHAAARLDLGRHLALSLEFLVAKDVLDSIVEPTWDELGKLAAVVALRTVIQFSLSRELRDVVAGEG